MEPRVRPVGPEDLEEIVALAVRARAQVKDERGGAALLADLGLHADAADLTGRLADPATMVWCATLDDVPVGHLVAAVHGTELGRIVTVSELWVAPEARDVGAGEALVTAAIAWAIAEEAVAIDAHALPGAREAKNLFERMGLTTRLLTVRRALT